MSLGWGHEVRWVGGLLLYDRSRTSRFADWKWTLEVILFNANTARAGNALNTYILSRFASRSWMYAKRTANVRHFHKTEVDAMAEQ